MARCSTWKEKNSKIIDLGESLWINWIWRKAQSIEMGKMYTNLYESLEILN